MWFLIWIMIVNGQMESQLIPVQDQADCEKKAHQIIERIVANPDLNKPENTAILSCKKVNLT